MRYLLYSLVIVIVVFGCASKSKSKDGGGSSGGGDPEIKVAFSASPTSGTAPLTVNFTDSSTTTSPGATINSWQWDFDNNGTIDSTSQNPTYQYTTAGTYSVKLTVTDTAGKTGYLIKTNYITVTTSSSNPGSGGTGGAKGAYTDTITVSGKTRTYLVYCPNSVQDPAPLLVFFHGMGGSYIDGYYCWANTANSRGFVLVCPQAQNINGTIMWDFDLGDDLKLVDALVAKIESLYNIALKREYLSGFSNGALYSIYVGIKRSEKFAALQSHSGGYVSGMPTDAARKIPIYLVHGEADTVVPISYSEAAYNVYTSKGHEVKFDRIPGLGHQWYFPKNDEVWNWFLARPLP